MAEIIDISNHQGRPDWNVVSRHVELSIAKATEGTYFRDGSFAHNWHGAARHGVQRGAYHFIYPRGGDPIAEARFFVGRVQAEGISRDDLLALDVEPHLGFWPLPAGEPSIRYTLACLEEIERLSGRTPLMYAGRSFLNTHLRADQRLRRFPLWIAEYTSRPAPKNPYPYALWQWTSSGRVPGIAGRVDLNRRGTVPLPGTAGGGGGFLMALSDSQQAEVYGWLRGIVQGIEDPEAAKLFSEDGKPVPPLMPTVRDTHSMIRGLAGGVTHGAFSADGVPYEALGPALRKVAERLETLASGHAPSEPVDAEAVAAALVAAGLGDAVVDAIHARTARR